MNTTTDVGFWKSVLQFLERQFQSPIKAFVLGGVLVSLGWYFFVVQSKDKLITYLEKDNEFWKNRYDNSPDEMQKVFNFLNGVKNNNTQSLIQSEKHLEIIEQQNQKLKELERKN